MNWLLPEVSPLCEAIRSYAASSQEDPPPRITIEALSNFISRAEVVLAILEAEDMSDMILWMKGVIRALKSAHETLRFRLRPKADRVQRALALLLAVESWIEATASERPDCVALMSELPED
jgi:hypothetical protein